MYAKNKNMRLLKLYVFVPVSFFGIFTSFCYCGKSENKFSVSIFLFLYITMNILSNNIKLIIVILLKHQYL